MDLNVYNIHALIDLFGKPRFIINIWQILKEILIQVG